MSNLGDLVCFSHLRWGFVFQRPNHLMSRAARTRRTFFIEEPRFDAPSEPGHLELVPSGASLLVAIPHLPDHLKPAEIRSAMRTLLEQLFRERQIRPSVLWYYTPMALPFTRHLDAPLIVYDCMDELAAFKDSPADLPDLEIELFQRADLVFTGGHSLYYWKQNQHSNIHAFPSSVDASHFFVARNNLTEPADQARIPRPRIGYFGVIDERLDLDLLDGLAQERPDWHQILVGPVAKIPQDSLPKRPNIHWLGKKDYASLPAYLSGWDVAMMPFALNRSTRFISPTKTLEYMSAGKPIVSTAIEDVVEPYGHAGAVHVADRTSFSRAVDAALARDREEMLRTSDAWVARTSWDKTWNQMEELMQRTLIGKLAAPRKGRTSCTTT